jgi:DNA-directed RNA polymerase subunit M/transcription elongation factor TFIIS
MPKKQRPGAVTIDPQPTQPEAPKRTGRLDEWIETRALQMMRLDYYDVEIQMGVMTVEEAINSSYNDQDMRSLYFERIRAELEFLGEEEWFKTKLGDVTSKPNLEDILKYNEDFINQQEQFSNKEVVYFKNRPTAFTLDKPCFTCGQKQLIPEAAVFTRAADEAQDQFATCKNCSSRFPLHSVM